MADAYIDSCGLRHFWPHCFQPKRTKYLVSAMKKFPMNLLSIVLPALCLSFAACTDQELHPRTPAENLIETPKPIPDPRFITKEIESGYVYLYLPDVYVRSENLPPQIKVDIKDANYSEDNLQFFDLPGIYEIKFHMGKVDNVTIGCDDKDGTEKTLPQEINATSVTLCGKLDTSGGLKITTSHLTMKNVELKTRSTNIDARLIDLVGENKINFKGTTDLYALSIAFGRTFPTFKLMNLEIGGTGNLLITADKTTEFFFY
jgi:hypothetical protein